LNHNLIKINKQKKTQLIIENDDDEDEEYEENYLQKFDYEVNKNWKMLHRRVK